MYPNRTSAGSYDNVGIGTTSPGTTLDVEGYLYGGKSNDYFLIRGKRDISGAAGSAGFIFQTMDGATARNRIEIDRDNIALYGANDGGSADMVIQSDGNVGIGDTNPTAKLDIEDNIANWATTIRNANAAGYGLLVDTTANTGAGEIAFRVSTANTGLTVTSDGNVGIGTTAPDAKLRVDRDSFPQVRINNMNAQGETGIRFRSLGASDAHADISFDGTGANTGNLDFRNPHTATRMRIQSNGNVGIGTTGPGKTLEVKSSTDTAQLRLRSSDGNSTFDLYSNNSTWAELHTSHGRFYMQKELWVDEGLIGSYNEDLKLHTAGTPRMTILNSNGNVGIGTTSPGAKLDVRGKLLVDPQNADATRAESLTVVGTGSGNYSPGSDLGDTNRTLSIISDTAQRQAVLGFRNINDESVFIDIVAVPGTASTRAGSRLGFHMRNATGWTEALSIKAEGNVGIGNTGPSAKLDIRGGSEAGSSSIFTSVDATSGNRRIIMRHSKTGTNSYYRLRLPQAYNNQLVNGGGVTVKVTWLGGHAIASHHQEYKFTYGTNHTYSGTEYLTTSKISPVYRNNNPYSYSYVYDQTPDVDFYLDGTAGIGAVIMNIKGRQASYASKALIDIEISGQTASTPTLTYVGTTLPAGSTAIGSKATALSYGAGDYLIYSDEPAYSVDDSDANYKLMKSFRVSKSGTVRIKFSGYIQSGPYYWAWKIAKNGGSVLALAEGGNATGPYSNHLDTGETSSVHSYRRFKIDVKGLEPGDLLELWMASSTGGGGIVTGVGQDLYAKEFRIYSASPSVEPVSANIWGKRVGIGTTAPTELLHVYNNTGSGDADAYVKVQASGTGEAGFRIARADGTNLWDIESGSAYGDTDLGFYYRAGSTEAMRISSAGNVTVAGNLSIGGQISKGSGSFLIDHPLDPLNKVLRHSFVESPDMKNVYDGVVILDENGESTIELPDYFEALNRDFRYQLTPVGSPAMLFIKEEIEDNGFTIAGGESGMKVCWQVTGTRIDAHAMKHRIIVEEEKGGEGLPEKGKYLHPDCFE